MVLSSAIVCDSDRRIADDRRSSFHMIADDRRPYCDLRSAIIWKPAFTASAVSRDPYSGKVMLWFCHHMEVYPDFVLSEILIELYTYLNTVLKHRLTTDPKVRLDRFSVQKGITHLNKRINLKMKRL